MKELCYDVITCAERLVRVFAENMKRELEKEQVLDVNYVQALLVYNISQRTISIGDLTSCGLYNGSNVTYNLKKLISEGYLTQSRTPNDKRTLFVRLSDKGWSLHKKVTVCMERQNKILNGLLPPSRWQTLYKSLNLLEEKLRLALSSRN